MENPISLAEMLSMILSSLLIAFEPLSYANLFLSNTYFSIILSEKSCWKYLIHNFKISKQCVNMSTKNLTLLIFYTLGGFSFCFKVL